ncbi:MAG: hypothetical protein DME43_00500 [Verrucomicrobia bacterium]|nr:MAG: hypothetical protein DME43_00500 [Verrucomicrobiota bacterium]
MEGAASAPKLCDTTASVPPMSFEFTHTRIFFGSDSARVSRVGDRVLAIADFSKIVLARRQTNTRDACATRSRKSCYDARV